MKSCLVVAVIMIVIAGIALSSSQARPLQGEAAVIQGCEQECSSLLPAWRPWGQPALRADDYGCWGVCDAGLVFFGAFDEDDEAMGGRPWWGLQAPVMAEVFDPVNMSR